MNKPENTIIVSKPEPFNRYRKFFFDKPSGCHVVIEHEGKQYKLNVGDSLTISFPITLDGVLVQHRNETVTIKELVYES